MKEFQLLTKDVKDEEFTDYGATKLQELKKQNPSEYFSKSKQIEREVQFLFEEFDEENWSLEQDKRIRERNKILAELSEENITQSEPSESSFSKEYLLKCRPQLSNQIESIKMNYFSTRRAKPKSETAEFEDVDEDLIKIMKGDFQVQSFAYLSEVDNWDISSRNKMK